MSYTRDEKKQVVQQFIREVNWLKADFQKCPSHQCYMVHSQCFVLLFQYLDQNPEAILDGQLLAGLNTMAVNLVEKTFDEKSGSTSVSRQH